LLQSIIDFPEARKMLEEGVPPKWIISSAKANNF
jgi:hypothetical protein